METLIAYYAGLFDGEGTITIRGPSMENGKFRNRFQVQLSISMTDEKVIRGFAEFFGTGNVKEKAPQKPGWKKQWRYEACGSTATSVVARLLPYLQVKERPARLAIELQDLIRNEGHPRRLGYSAAQFQKREDLLLEIRECHKLGRGR